MANDCSQNFIHGINIIHKKKRDKTIKETFLIVDLNNESEKKKRYLTFYLSESQIVSSYRPKLMLSSHRNSKTKHEIYAQTVA